MFIESAKWIKQAEYDLGTAEDMFKAGRYIYTIFMCHLAVEKALKALIVEHTGNTPPRSHNLVYLFNSGNAKLSDEQVKFITRLSLAGVVTRYPEDLDQAIQDYSQEVTSSYLKQAKEVVQCLKQQI
jgi:HEPN domain-containing protein